MDMSPIFQNKDKKLNLIEYGPDAMQFRRLNRLKQYTHAKLKKIVFLFKSK